MDAEFRYTHNITNKLADNKPKLDQCIDTIIQKEGYTTYDVQKNEITADGGSHLAKLYEIKIKGKTELGDKETSLFVKILLTDSIDEQLVSLKNIFNKELFMYTELSQVFEELQDEAEIPTDERFKRIKSYDESYSNAIILENITKQGFKALFRMDCVTLDAAEASIKELAKFHSLSFVIKNKRPDYFERTIKPLDQLFLFDSKVWDEFRCRFTGTALSCLDEDLRRRVADKIPGLLDKYSQYLQDKDSTCSLCHGDNRPNNVMVREEEGKIIEVIPVDYQLIHYGCPVLDFFYFIYIGADSEFRQKNMTRLRDLYFESLEKYQRHFDMAVESVYPRERFEREFKEKRDYGLMVCVLYLSFIFVSEDALPDLTKEKIQDLDMVLNGTGY